MWEIIKRNKQKSTLALSVMGLWYCIIYGIIFAIIILFTLANILPEKSRIFDTVFSDSTYIVSLLCTGILIALLVFIIRFSLIQDKPYNINDCTIHPIDKTKNKQLYNIVEEVAISSGISKIPQIYILNSDILNAYACGLKPEKSSIVISKKLLEILSREELQGVVAHEMSHIINRDTTYLLCSGALFTISAALSAFFANCIEGRGNKSAPLFMLLLLISLLGQAVCFILFMFISRKREYLADACAAQFTRYPKGLADALLKLEKNTAKKNITENPDNLIKASCIVPLEKKDELFSTHPLTQNRVQILLNMTSADYREYEKEFQKLNNIKLIPDSVLQNSSKVEIKKVEEIIKPESIVVAACALNTVASNNDVKIIQDNKEVLEENIKKHREVEDMVRDLANYKIINCECNTKLKIPPVYKNTVIICPHCKKKHVV